MTADPSSPAKPPVVLRFADMTPAQIARFEAHRLRRGESGEHADPSKANRLLIGSETWASEARQLIERMRRHNHLIEAETLRRRGRGKALDEVLERGPQDPWDARATGPMREVILTAHKDWFREGELEAFFNGGGPNRHETAFEQTAITWLRDNFGDDVVHARADHDETTYHIHAVIMPVKKMLKRPKGRGEPEVPIPGEDLFTHKGKPCKVNLVGSKHPLLRNYELAQDSVGLAFADIGLRRGERHWAATRQALAEGREADPRPKHKPAHVWRAEKERELKDQAARQAEAETILQGREAALAEREDRVVALMQNTETIARQSDQKAEQAETVRTRAEAILAVADAIADGQIDPEAADVRTARQGSKVTPEVEERMQAAPEAADQAFAHLRKAYAAMRVRAQEEIRPALAAMERTGQAWAELQSRVRAMVKNGKLTQGLFGALFGGLTGTQRQALDKAEQEARRYQDHPGSDEKE